VRYLVESAFKTMPTPETMALIPAEMIHGQKLDAQRVRLKLFVAADQSKAWQVFQAKSLEEAQAIVASFPLHPYLNSVITPLADEA
jgi:muconolactone delta-isomerase